MYKLEKIYRFFFIVLAALLLQGNVLAQDAVPSDSVFVDYDRFSDRIILRASETQLKLLLKQVAVQSGIEVMFDDMADETVSVELQADTLERGLKQLLKGKNYLLRYREGSPKVLIGVMVLPAGTEGAGEGRARRVVSMDNEAYLRARWHPSLEQQRQRDLTIERWQTRLSELPAEKRRDILERLDNRLKKAAMREKEWKEKIESHEKMLAARKEAREKAFDARWDSMDPAEKAAFRASQQKYAEQVRQQLNSQSLNSEPQN